MGESAEKVVAITRIPRGSSSLKLQQGQGHHHQGLGFGLEPLIKVVGIWRNDELQPLDISQLSSFWPKLIPLASDCSVQNVRLSRGANCEPGRRGELVLQAIKDIQQGEELLLWFDEEILAELEIPSYLSPVNIRGGNSYICHHCSRSFEAPNNLKIHIALNCGTLPNSILWKRLFEPPNSSHAVRASRYWSTPLISSTNNCPPLIPLLINAAHQTTTLLHQPRPQLSMSSRVSASTVPLQFGTIRNGESQTSVAKKAGESTARTKLKSSKSSKRPESNPSVDKSISISDPEAQLESIVSNMGKARNGHMCLYCGKLYSRKYGLKIHIRTHTGYKPLQCKICQRPFGDPSNLNKHIRLHSSGNTPYRCDICHKVLVRKRDLERHIKSRHTDAILQSPEGVVGIIDCRLDEDGEGAGTGRSASELLSLS